MKTKQYHLHIYTAGYPLIYRLTAADGSSGDIYKFQNTTTVEKLQKEYNIIKITRGDDGQW